MQRSAYGADLLTEPMGALEAQSDCGQAEGAPEGSAEVSRICKTRLVRRFGEGTASGEQRHGALDAQPKHVGFERQSRLRDKKVPCPAGGEVYGSRRRRRGDSVLQVPARKGYHREHPRIR
jgi:hypothetical protein